MNKVIAFGDSIMKGVVVKPYENQLVYEVTNENFIAKCEQRLGCPIENISRFGYTIMHAQKFFDRLTKNMGADDLVFLCFGSNDSNFDWKTVAENPNLPHHPNTTLNDFYSTYSLVIDKVREKSAVPVMLSLPTIDSNLFFDFVSRGLNKDNIIKWLGGDPNYINNWHEQYNLEIFKLGFHKQAPVIDISTAFLSKRNLGDYYCVDGMHPNEAGQALIADTMLAFVDEHSKSLSKNRNHSCAKNYYFSTLKL